LDISYRLLCFNDTASVLCCCVISFSCFIFHKCIFFVLSSFSLICLEMQSKLFLLHYLYTYD
jgi:hypothetical protein